MIPTTIMSAGLNLFVLSLTPVQRWQAARWLNISFMGESWFMTTCIAALIIMTALFIIVTCHQAGKERLAANRLFFEYADEKGLSPRERHVLMYIATQAKLKNKEAIFTMADAFDRGATKIIRAALALKGKDKRTHLNAELSVLREKLGFQKRNTLSADRFVTETPGSRQIPGDRKLYITALETDNFSHIECAVIENNEMELVVEPSKRLEMKLGEPLCVRYYFEASIWEFDTAVVMCRDNHLILKHTDDVRTVNRRRFLRVPIKEPAYIAAFPFAKTLPDSDKSAISVSSESSSENNWGPPKFVPADVTELAGPGLRVVAPLEVKVGDRVVVIMKLSESKKHPLIQRENSEALHSVFAGRGKSKPARIVEDIGVVRHTENTRDGFSIAVELTGLNEKNLNELVRATNTASLKARFETQLVPENIGSWKKNTNTVSETIIV
jgi:hypothetical protein